MEYAFQSQVWGAFVLKVDLWGVGSVVRFASQRPAQRAPRTSAINRALAEEVCVCSLPSTVLLFFN